MEKITLPEIGDGISSGVVISVQKEANELIKEGDILAEIETDKAAFPVNSPLSGVVKKILIKEGQEVGVGEILAEVEVGSAPEGESEAPPVEEASKEVLQEASQEASQGEVERVAVKKDEDLADDKRVVSLEPVVEGKSPSPSVESSVEKVAADNKGGSKIHAGPATRKLARELGVDLSFVSGTARGSRISIDDLKKFVKEQMGNEKRGEGVQVISGQAASKELPDFSVFGETEIKPASHLRGTIAAHIRHSYFSIPHVHQFSEVDLTSINRYQKEFKSDFKSKGSTFSVTVFIIKALAVALNKFPLFNSSYDDRRNAIHYKKYFNIGVAVDTPSGLIVPVIKNVDELSLFGIGKRLVKLAEETRERKVKLEDLRGASMTLSNLGGIGGTYFNPIINWPEVAILGVGRNFVKPVHEEGQWIPRQVLPIVLAYDHRVIDGADGARFVSYLKSILEKPEKFLIGLEHENK